MYGEGRDVEEITDFDALLNEKEKRTSLKEYGLQDVSILVKIDNNKTVQLKFDTVLNAATQAPSMIEQLIAGLSFIKTPTYQKAATNPVQHRKPTCAYCLDTAKQIYCNVEVDNVTVERCNDEFAKGTQYFKDRKGNAKYYCNEHFKAIIGKLKY